MMLSSSYVFYFTIIFGSMLWSFPAMGCVLHDANMLLAFKNNVLLYNIAAPTHAFLQSWKNGTDCCKSWERVVCNPSKSHVQHLHLHSSSYSPLKISLNASSARIALHPLSRLPGLTYLDLSGNTLEPSAVLSSLSKFPVISHILISQIVLANSAVVEVGSISLDEWSHESLKRIRYLDLGMNKIGGRLPSKLSNMSNLLYLDLCGNHFTFTSEVMEMSLPSMKSLQYLDLWDMNLSMTTQHFWHNSIANLSYLSHLGLWDCSLTVSNVGQQMSWLGKLPKLEYLSLKENFIKAPFPHVLNNLTKLTFLDMSGSMLQGEIPATLGLHLHNLHTLYLESNNLVGTIPNSLANMSSLQTLDMSNNNFITRFPEGISGITNLTYFRLNSAQLIGSISSSFTLPSKLQFLDVRSNNMTGTISDAFFGNSSELGIILMSNSGLTINVSPTWIPPLDAKEILFGSCNIGGNFPEWTSLLQDLITLDLSSNGIVGNLPSWFSDGAARLGYLDICNNSLEGSLPVNSIGNGGLVVLDASSNKFTTAQFGECVYLQLLNLKNNNFQGRLPHHFGKGMPRLRFLSLENNEFVGALPDSLGGCISLQILNLANNNFEGKFPRWIFNLHDLKVLKLSSNSLGGDIPDEIGIMTKLQFMDLSFNEFNGVIPHSLWNLPSLQHKIPVLANETINFYGLSKIGVLVGDFYEYHHGSDILDFYSKGVRLDYQVILKALTCIDLSHNYLSGRLPTNVGKKLKGLKQLNLSHNNFLGSIPESVSEMDELESLDLSHNHFFGKIPRGFGGLSALEFLDLSYNNLSGIIPRAGQMQTFDPSRFVGNMNLTDPENNNRKEDSGQLGTCCEKEDDSMRKYNVEELLWGLSVGLSFGVGFAGFTLIMIFNKAIKTKALKFMDYVIQVWIFNY